jgi:oxaloacetate decarboxylase alpha subunit
VTSPLAGRIVEVHAQVGQAVAEGDLVVTLEAMKMNTQVFAACGGKVSAINVKAGDAVQEGDVLLTVG